MPRLRRFFALEGHSLLTKTGFGQQRRYNAVRRPIILSSLSSLVVIAILITCLPRHDRFGDQASILAYSGFDLVGDVGIFLEELLGIFATLTDALAVIGKPGAGFLDHVRLDAKVDQLELLYATMMERLREIGRQAAAPACDPSEEAPCPAAL